MALGTRYTKTVVFIIGGSDRESAVARGTGFVAGTLSDDPDVIIPFVVTAAHVVRTFVYTAVRLTLKDGTVEDRAIGQWEFHDHEDVAVSFLGEIDVDRVDISAIPIDHFVGYEETQFAVGVGDPVYFGGLLGSVPSMGDLNVPMIRTGSVGALYQSGVPMRLLDNTLIHVRGHLIDCRSFGGFSGSPCFVRFTSATGETPRRRFKYPVESTQLLGMVIGHFDLAASVQLSDQEDKISVPVSAGIAVVYPAELIRETLEEAAARY
jgi:hypothetical protein